MNKHYLEVPRTSRYYVQGNTEEPSSLWIALHGYGQLGEFFSPKLSALDDGNNLVVTCEALNRFYLSGYNGRVGATWMTKDDREADIKDNHRYLNTLLEKLLQEYSSISSVNILAFSQGIATACRWQAQLNQKIDQVIWWAGSIPPDLQWSEEGAKFKTSRISYVFGNEDEFFNEEKIQANCSLLRSGGVEFQLVTFEGRHVMHDETLKSLLR